MKNELAKTANRQLFQTTKGTIRRMIDTTGNKTLVMEIVAEVLDELGDAATPQQAMIIKTAMMEAFAEAAGGAK